MLRRSSLDHNEDGPGRDETASIVGVASGGAANGKEQKRRGTATSRFPICFGSGRRRPLRRRRCTRIKRRSGRFGLSWAALPGWIHGDETPAFRFTRQGSRGCSRRLLPTHAPDVRADRLGHFAHNCVLAHDLVLVEVRGSLTWPLVRRGTAHAVRATSLVWELPGVEEMRREGR